MWVVSARRLLPCLAFAAACGDPQAHVKVVPIAFPDHGAATSCGKPDAVNLVRLIAYTGTGELRRTDAQISDFPANTEQLGVEVIVAGGDRGAIGKTPPIAFNDLPDGTVLPVAMVPPDGFCRVGDLGEARVAPLVARAGDGALVVGGAAQPSAEYYDPTTATFEPIALPAGLRDDSTSLIGAALTAMPDGRAVLTGGGGRTFAVFVPERKAFLGAYTITPRLSHAAIAVDDSQLLVIGGCNSPSGLCDAGATPLHSSLAYTYSRSSTSEGEPGEPEGKVSLPPMRTSFGGRLIDLGTESDGVRRFVLAGGFGDAGVAERIPFASSGVTTTVTGVFSQIAQLDGGAVLTAFDRDGAPASGASSVLPPESDTVVPLSGGPALARARLSLLEDGSVVAIGGDSTGRISRFVPTTNTWTTTTPPGEVPIVDAPVLTRLADGSVLVLGGAASGSSAWLYRPSLVGPHSGDVRALPLGTADGVLTAPNPGTLTATRFTLHANDDTLAARALVGGPRNTTGSVKASVRISGGVALIAQQTSPGRALLGELVAGQPARVLRLDGATQTTSCTGDLVGPFDPNNQRTVALAVVGHTATLSLDDMPIATCDLSGDPHVTDRGSWGIAAVGTNAEVEVVTITVGR
ncbi:MAG: hypothetical protein JWO36_715 [Myxococcales bacterium]|nr:hypothetical protein [Myxococcales bacterium]